MALEVAKSLSGATFNEFKYSYMFSVFGQNMSLTFAKHILFNIQIIEFIGKWRRIVLDNHGNKFISA